MSLSFFVFSLFSFCVADITNKLLLHKFSHSNSNSNIETPEFARRKPKTARPRYSEKLQLKTTTCDVSDYAYRTAAETDASLDDSWRQSVTEQKQPMQAARSTHEDRRLERPDRRLCGVSSSGPWAAMLLTTVDVVESHRRRPSGGPWPGTRAQCGYDNGKPARPVDI